jgi:hypothetical protein
MADRMDPYPVDMFPQNLTPNFLQQSEISQHPPQSQQPDPQMVSVLSNPEHSQLEDPHCLQQSGDLSASQMHQASLSVSRKLKILIQQEISRLQQSGLGAQHAPNKPTIVDMFASLSIQPSQDQVHGSPHPTVQSVGPPGANQGMVPGNQKSTAQKRRMTPAEFQERKNYLLGLISQSEGSMASLSQNVRNANSIDPHTLQKIIQLRTELARRKDMYTKFVTTFGPMVSQQMVNGIPSHMYVLSIVGSLVIVDVFAATLWHILPRSSLSSQPCPIPRSSLVLILRQTNLLRHSTSFLVDMLHLRFLARVKML